MNNMEKIYSIAIDGPAGAGKSTVARAVADALRCMYLDTGAMYRTIGLYFLRRNMLEDTSAIASGCKDIPISVVFENGIQHMLLGDEDVSDAIRTPEASMAASCVGAIPEVRERLVALQQETAKGISIIMDGRDIATKVLPNATVKIYLTASCEVRALRRYAELRDKGEDVLYHNVLDDIASRDYNDTHRAASPLTRAEDAVLVDTSAMTVAQSVNEVVRVCRAVIEGV